MGIRFHLSYVLPVTEKNAPRPRGIRMEKLSSKLN